MVMEPTREPINADADHYVEYKYKKGDKVDIFCYKDVDLSKECTIAMKYYYNELIDNILELKSSNTVQSHIELHRKHSGSYIDCIYTCNNDYQLQRMKFVLDNDFNKDIKLLINEQEPRINMSSGTTFKSGVRTITVPYHISKDESFNITCGEDSDHNHCNTVCVNLSTSKCISVTWEIRNLPNHCTFYCGNTFKNLDIQLEIRTSNKPTK